MSVDRTTVARALVVLLLLTMFVGLRPARADACACDPLDYVGAISMSDIASAASPDDGDAAEDGQAPSPDEGRSTSGLIVAIVMLGVLVVGLRAIKRQRDEGRRGKLPPIG